MVDAFRTSAEGRVPADSHKAIDRGLPIRRRDAASETERQSFCHRHSRKRLISLGDGFGSPARQSLALCTFTEYLICFSVSNVQIGSPRADIATEMQLICSAF
jgi:hypothetical protein